MNWKVHALLQFTAGEFMKMGHAGLMNSCVYGQ